MAAMTNQEAYKLIGKRIEELIAEPKIQEKIVYIAKAKNKEEAEKWLYMTAIATLIGD